MTRTDSWFTHEFAHYWADPHRVVYGKDRNFRIYRWPGFTPTGLYRRDRRLP